ncbi:Multimodular transpeptidase-transglycosylase [Acidisarcina polymorpha]|uniref:Multimodular transpeptidase-transglycosylase n=1 Tax=Acidisarcina polymorpha TaxID=2211140 RepID=A0A2Z5G622_9BACT|nr:Multimodular transpeptidase-transglycosylase [Acidisarcina polymorpha]
MGSGKLQRSLLMASAAVVALGLLVGGLVFGYYWFKYKHIVDERLTQPLFENTAKIYAAPREVRPGQRLSAHSVAQELRNGGYSEDGAASQSPMGHFSESADSIEIHPGPESYHSEDGATISFENGKVSQITGDGNVNLNAYELEPLLITGLSEDKSRTKRRLVDYDELPQNLVHAVVSIEDHRFFQHGGVDYIGVLRAIRNDLTHRHNYTEGGSTLTMQLARGFFLTPEKRIKRKLIEIVITYQLESRFNKQKIFQLYANEIPLGQQGSFAINGFGEAARAYFNKDVRQLDLAECALLAGMIQSPSRLNPYRHAERAMTRRNLVLDTMVETGSITKAQAEAAKAEPLKLAPTNVNAGEAPYFVDLVREQLTQKLGENSFNREGLRIYTSLDPELQHAATQAVEVGSKLVDELVLKQHTRKEKDGTITTTGEISYPQISLVALNPHTGQVLALVGGRNYGISQLNHAVAKRPTGSIFKPFVYASAFNSAVAGTKLDSDGTDALFTPVTMLNDEQTTFTYAGDQEYNPKNYKDEYHGEVTATYALAHSLNNATISLAQMVGFGNVASLARSAGIRSAQGTPSVALGTYSASPLDMAGAYTVFANGGIKIDPWLLASVRSASGDVLNDYTPTSKPVLDPRVAYLTTSMMEGVMNFGYGYAVRQRGFLAPAAGKTGTSNDAWFAGYTSNLICIVWIGNDDYKDVKLQGAVAAAPIWAEFMKAAVKLPQYSDTREFVPPTGVTVVQLDKETNLLADASCPSKTYNAAFLQGTEPTDTCDHLNGDQRSIFQKLFGLGDKSTMPALPPGTHPTVVGQPALPAQTAQTGQVQTSASAQSPNPAVAEDSQPKKKKGFFSRLFGGGKNEDKKPAPQPTQPQPSAPQQ